MLADTPAPGVRVMRSMAVPCTLAVSSRATAFLHHGADYYKFVAVSIRAPQTGGVKGGFEPPGHLLTSFHTVLIMEFGGHLPSLPSF